MKQTKNKKRKNPKSTTTTKSIARELIRILYFEASKEPIERYIENTAAAFRALVAGDIEHAPLGDGVVLLVNEQGKVNNLPPNRLLKDPSGRLYDIAVGNCFAIRIDGEEYVSLTDADVARWSALPKAIGENQSQALAATRTGTLPAELDLRHFDAPACDQWYPGAVVAMTSTLAKKWGPTCEGSTRAWDIVFMSCCCPKKERTRDGHLFGIVVVSDEHSEDIGVEDIEVQMRAHYFGGDAIEYVVISLADEDNVDIPGLDLTKSPIFGGLDAVPSSSPRAESANDASCVVAKVRRKGRQWAVTLTSEGKEPLTRDWPRSHALAQLLALIEECERLGIGFRFDTDSDRGFVVAVADTVADQMLAEIGVAL